MAIYWTTFRIHEDRSYAKRYEKLMGAIRDTSADIPWWVESTSFVLWSSELSLNDIAATISAALNHDTDLALIGMPEVKAARIVGASTDQDLFKLMPFTKKA